MLSEVSSLSPVLPHRQSHPVQSFFFLSVFAMVLREEFDNVPHCWTSCSKSCFPSALCAAANAAPFVALAVVLVREMC